MAEPSLRASRAAAAATLALLAGCIAETALPTFGPTSALSAAGTSGRLRLDGTCLRLETAGGASFLVVWPHGARVDYGLKPPLVQDGAGGTARVGDIVRLSGAPASDGWAARSRKAAGIIRRCGGPLFVTHGFAGS